MAFLKSLIVACGLALLPALVHTSPIVPRYFQRTSVSPRNLNSWTVEAELGKQLASGSLIFGSNDTRFTDATDRWNTLFQPNIQLVVEPAAEADIAKIVKYCNENGIDFLVYNRGHGTTASLGTFSGIEINVDQLVGITIQPDGETAIFQAGTYGALVMQTLWDQGYVTTTGTTPCVGLMGPALGGGHSAYEGLYGMVMDGAVHYNIVLANGTEIGVNETSHSDLLWALKGAGHNFAIITSVVKKIYPKEIDTWHYHTYTWTQDKLETVFELLNQFHKSYNGTTPPKMGVNYGSIKMNTSYSTTEAVLEWGFRYAGPSDEAEELLIPFNAIDALTEAMGDETYPVLSGVAEDVCPSGNWVISSVLTLDYNITAERAIYNNFITNMAKYPELVDTAYLWHEGYATAGYQAIPSDSTAYPHREDNHLMVFFADLPAGTESTTLLDSTETWAKEAWDIWNGGQPDRLPHTYVNYAEGHDYETLESIYGYESWRLDRLRSLKAAYDPENRFRFYNPIVSDTA
ncbi:unnamed protein product [Discula destructiva]